MLFGHSFRHLTHSLPLAASLAVAALGGGSFLLPTPAAAYSYAAAGKEPLIDGREAALAAIGAGDWAKVSTVVDGLKTEVSYLEEHHAKGLSGSLTSAISAKDEKALRTALATAFSAEIVRRLDGAGQNLKDFQTSKVLVIKAKRFLDAMGGDLDPAKRNSVDASLTAALGALGNPGVFGVGAKQPDAAAFAQAQAAVSQTLGLK